MIRHSGIVFFACCALLGTARRNVMSSRAAPYRVLLLLVIGCMLPACYNLRVEPSPVPDQEFAAVLMRSGQRVEVPNSYRARIEDDSLVVRRIDGRRIDAVPRTAVDSLYVRELDAGRTALAIVGGGLTATAAFGLLVLAALSDM